MKVMPGQPGCLPQSFIAPALMPDQTFLPRVPKYHRGMRQPHLPFTHMRRLLLSILALLLTACGSATSTTATISASRTGTVQPTAARTAGHTPPPPAAPKTVIYSFGIPLVVIDNDGTYVIGLDIQDGKYRSAGGRMCYWARLRSLNSGDIIEDNKASDPQVVEIQATDTAFLTRNCGTWQMMPGF